VYSTAGDTPSKNASDEEGRRLVLLLVLEVRRCSAAQCSDLLRPPGLQVCRRSRRSGRHGLRSRLHHRRSRSEVIEQGEEGVARNFIPKTFSNGVLGRGTKSWGGVRWGRTRPEIPDLTTFPVDADPLPWRFAHLASFLIIRQSRIVSLLEQSYPVRLPHPNLKGEGGQLTRFRGRSDSPG
jgi:hypothetical protein